jgi:hypothetical protein
MIVSFPERALPSRYRATLDIVSIVILFFLPFPSAHSAASAVFLLSFPIVLIVLIVVIFNGK